MGLVTMHDVDLKRIDVPTEVLAGRRTACFAAAVPAISLRQVHRLLLRYRDGGGGWVSIGKVHDVPNGGWSLASASMGLS
jgi:hypothetical protein